MGLFFRQSALRAHHYKTWPSPKRLPSRTKLISLLPSIWVMSVDEMSVVGTVLALSSEAAAPLLETTPRADDGPQHDGDADDTDDEKPQFGLFSKLAVELRIKIWSFAFKNRERQIVAISTPKHDCKSHEGTWCPRYNSNPPPVLVNVCHESRQIAYEEAAKTDQLHFLCSSFPNNPGIIFDPQNDILYIPNDEPPHSMLAATFIGAILAQVHMTPILKTMRSLALNLNPLRSNQQFHDIGMLRSLEELIFVARQMGDRERTAMMTASGFLRGMTERRRTRAGSYGDAPDGGNFPTSAQFALRTDKGIEINQGGLQGLRFGDSEHRRRFGDLGDLLGGLDLNA